MTICEMKLICMVSGCFIEDTNVALPFELSNSTKEFNKLYLDTNQCLADNYNETSKKYNQNVCENCSLNYCKMNGFYGNLKQDLGDGQLCMDIVDTVSIFMCLKLGSLSIEIKSGSASKASFLAIIFRQTGFFSILLLFISKLTNPC